MSLRLLALIYLFIKLVLVSNLQSASCWLVWALCCKEDERIIWFDLRDKIYCDQPGCAEYASVLYRIKNHYTNQGELSEYQPENEHRKFCQKHKERGDSDMEDCDRNYEFVGNISVKSKHHMRSIR